MLVVTDAIVLHAFDYLETSRILRLLTLEAGVQSVLAKGARRSRGRVGSAVDLFAQGEAQMYVKPTRDLQTLAAFDVTTSRASLALDMDRFLAASAIAELALQLGGGEANPLLYKTISDTLAALATALSGDASLHALGGGWRTLAAAGFAPTLDHCASCHAQCPVAVPLAFSPAAGGALCDRCARRATMSRRLPPEVRETLQTWLRGEYHSTPLTTKEARAHQRLLREFLTQHLPSDRPLRAFTAWECEFTQSSRPPAAL